MGCTPNIRFCGWEEKTGCDVMVGFCAIWLAGWDVVGIKGAMPAPLKPSKPFELEDLAAIVFKDVP